jgi:Tfp pilus assembly protein PilN
MNGRNLIPSYRRAAKARGRRLRAWMVTGVAYSALLLGAYVGCRMTWGGDRGALAGEREKIETRMQQVGRTVRSLQRDLETQNETLRAVQAIENQPDWSLLLALLPAHLTEDVFLRRCEIRPAGPDTAPGTAAPGEAYVLKVTGYGRTMTSVLGFVQALEGLGLFDQVRLTHTSSEPLMSGTAINFQVECLMTGSGEKSK